jgi:hypothetical protein
VIVMFSKSIIVSALIGAMTYSDVEAVQL